jgi:hypothetical protein
MEGGNSHVIAEVRWDGDWHMLDPTWGAYWSAPGDRGTSSPTRSSRPDSPRAAHKRCPGLVLERPGAVSKAKFFNYFKKAEGIYAP